MSHFLPFTNGGKLLEFIYRQKPNSSRYFTEIALSYLKYQYCFKDIYEFSTAPITVKNHLQITSHWDTGIDYIAYDNNFKAYAILVRYMDVTTDGVLQWVVNGLQTFFDLCNRTGPWENLIIFTNAKWIKLSMEPNKNLVVIENRKINEIDWKLVWDNKEPEKIEVYPNKDQLRKYRLAKFAQN